MTLVLGFGDSITAGTGASDYDHRWLTLVGQYFNSVRNSGIASTTLQNTVQNTIAVIGGATANNGRDTYHLRVSDYLPDYVLILYGVNDIRLNDVAFTENLFENDLGEVIDGIISDTGMAAANIIIGSPPYINNYALGAPQWNGGNIADHQAHVAKCAAVAAAKGCTYVDIYQYMIDNGDDALLSVDGVHPNDAGHQAIADAFLAALFPGGLPAPLTPANTLIIQPNAAAGKDTCVLSSFPTRNFGVLDRFLTDNLSKGLIEFNLAGLLPVGATIISATLKTYQALPGAAVAWTVSCYSISAANADWPEGTKNGSAGGVGDSCWNFKEQSPGSETAWAGAAGLAGAADYEAAVLGTFSGNAADFNGTEYICSLTPARVQGWISTPDTNYGLLLVPSASVGGLASSHHATPAWWPMLIIEYRRRYAPLRRIR